MPSEAPVETRNSTGDVRLETRETGHEDIIGLAAVFYDGSPGSQFQLWDGCFERILPGCFDRALRDGDDVRALFNHEPNLILGRTGAGTLHLWADGRGLFYRISPPNCHYAKDLISSLRRGDVSGSSFAFRVEDGGEIWKAEGATTIREVRSVQLFDVSPATYPAYARTAAAVSDIDAGKARAALARWRKGGSVSTSAPGEDPRARRLADARRRYKEFLLRGRER